MRILLVHQSMSWRTQVLKVAQNQTARRMCSTIGRVIYATACHILLHEPDKFALRPTTVWVRDRKTPKLGALLSCLLGCYLHMHTNRVCSTDNTPSNHEHPLTSRRVIFHQRSQGSEHGKTQVHVLGLKLAHPSSVRLSLVVLVKLDNRNDHESREWIWTQQHGRKHSLIACLGRMVLLTSIQVCSHLVQ